MLNKDYKLRYLPVFYDDLYGAVTYIRTKLKNPDAADRLIDKVEEAILELTSCAEAFEPYPSTRKRELPYYPIYVNNFIIFYVVIDHEIMEVRRFLYQRQNKDKII